MKVERLTRRDSLLRCMALGALRIAPGLGVAGALGQLEAQENRKAGTPTHWNEIGPYYKRTAPEHTMLRQAGDAGLPLGVSGTIYGTKGHAVEGAKIEIWQADHHGLYDLDGYRFRAMLTLDKTGKYKFDTVMPGHYPARVCQHIHYKITAPGHKPLVTQLYFATDPAFEGDPDRNFSRDPLVISRELVRPVLLSGDPGTMEAKVNFEIVLESL